MSAPAHRLRRAVRRVVLAGALVWPAACADPGLREAPAHLGADFGNAVSHNAAQQIVDPAPAHASADAPPMDGARAAGALQRYRSGAVIVPDTVETTTFGDDNR